ncbi:MAG: hypothetical protein CVU22_14045 [Betaproteobacteria bacterium HGW-Betaproteobacteria-16]|nr:MAG: hypothetical protein CVU22_14045 [Betaproteobacteria bacterium HGW-Betaproteobacteria-16]
MTYQEWLAALKPGDQVDVHYHLGPGGVRRKAVLTVDESWIRLGALKRKRDTRYWIFASATTGRTRHFNCEIKPPAGPLPQQGRRSKRANKVRA